MKPSISILIAGLFLTIACTDENPTTPDAEACFTIENPDESITAGNEVSFLNCSKNSTGYYWDFGDGGSSIEEHPNYVFTQEGSYFVTLVAGNETSVDSVKLNVVVELPELAVIGIWEAIGVERKGCTPGNEDGLENGFDDSEDYTGYSIEFTVEGKLIIDEIYDFELIGDILTFSDETYQISIDQSGGATILKLTPVETGSSGCTETFHFELID